LRDATRWLVLGDLLGAMGKQANFFHHPRSSANWRLRTSRSPAHYDSMGFKGLPVVDAPPTQSKSPLAAGAA
jgi:hypothetical protein